MPTLPFEIGQLVECHIKKNTILDIDFNEPRYLGCTLNTFEIIGKTDYGYVILVPETTELSISWRIKEPHISKYNINPNHLDKRGMIIRQESARLVGIKFKDPYLSASRCIRCYEPAPYVDAVPFTCWVCSHDPRLQ